MDQSQDQQVTKNGKKKEHRCDLIEHGGMSSGDSDIAIL